MSKSDCETAYDGVKGVTDGPHGNACDSHCLRERYLRLLEMMKGFMVQHGSDRLTLERQVVSIADDNLPGSATVPTPHQRDAADCVGYVQ